MSFKNKFIWLTNSLLILGFIIVFSTISSAQTITEVAVGSAEERSDQDVSIGSSDLEFFDDGGDFGSQTHIGVRFERIYLPAHAIITSAYITFTEDGSDNGTLTKDITIKGEKIASSSAFAAVSADVSGRTTTTASVNWTSSEWVGSENTDDISAIITEIIGFSWASGNDMSFIFTPTSGTAGDGDRVSYSASSSGNEPILVINYTLPNTTISVAVGANSDDAEEDAGGTVDVGSSDLELINDGTDQTVGIRFDGVTIAANATIDYAYIVFVADGGFDGATSLTVKGEDADASVTFVEVANDISGRTTTTASTAWNTISRWSGGDEEQTPDLSPIVQEIYDRGGWTSGNAMTFIVTGSGTRRAESQEGVAGKEAVLYINYSCPPPPPAGVTFYARQDGDWNDPNTWSIISRTGAVHGSIPGALNPVIIDSYDVSVTNGDQAALSVLMQNYVYYATLTIDNGYSLTITNDLNLLADRGGKDVDVIINDDNSTLTVGGDFKPVMNLGEHIDIIMTHNSNIQVDGSFLADLNSSNNNDLTFNLSCNSGSNHFHVDGDFEIDKDGARVVYFNFTNSAEMQIDGNMTIDHDNSGVDYSDIQYNLSNSSVLRIKGNLDVDINMVSSSDNANDIIINLDDNAKMEVGVGTGDLTKHSSLTSTNGDKTDIHIIIDGDASFITYGNLTIAQAQTGTDQVYNTYIYLNQNVAGTGSDALLQVYGNFSLTKDNGQFEYIYAKDGSLIDVGGDFSIDINGHRINNIGLYISLTESASVDIDGSLDIDFEETVRSGANFVFDIIGSSSLTVGVNSAPYTESCSIAFEGNDMDIYLEEDAVMTVYGDMNFIKSGGTLNNYNVDIKNDAQLLISDDLTLNNSSNANSIKIDIYPPAVLGTSAILSVLGDIDFTGASAANRVEIEADNDSYVKIGGNFLRNGSNFGIFECIGTSTLEFIGTAQQNWPLEAGGGTDAFTFQNIIVNNSNATVPQIVLQEDIDYLPTDKTITLTDGVVGTGSYRLDVNNTATTAITGHSVASYIFGNLRRYTTGTTSYDLPVGSAAQYELATINFTGGTTPGYLDAKFTVASETAPTPSLVAGAISVSTFLDYGYWTIKPDVVPGTAVYDVTLKSNGHTNGGLSADQHAVFKRDAGDGVGTWASTGTHNNGTQTGTGTAEITAKRTAITGFSDFIIGRSPNILFARRDGDWSDADQWSTASPTGASCSCTPGATDMVIIDGWDVTCNTNNYSISSIELIIDQHSGSSSLTISNGKTLSVANDVTVANVVSSSNHVELVLVDDNSTLNIGGNLSFEVPENNAGWANKTRLRMEDASVLNLTGTYIYNMDGGRVASGDDIEQVDLSGSAQFLCGSDVSVYLTADNSGGSDTWGYDFITRITGSAKWHIGGNALFDKDKIRDLSFLLSNTAQLDIDGDFTIDVDGSCQNNSDADFYLDNSSKVIVDGSIDFSFAEPTYLGCELIIDLDDDATFEVGVNNGSLAESATLTMTANPTTWFPPVSIIVEEDAQFKVYGDMDIIPNFANVNYGMEIKLNNDDDDAAINNALFHIYGDLDITKTNCSGLEINLQESSNFEIGGDVDIIATNGGNLDIITRETAEMNINGTMTINANTFNSNSRNVDLDIAGTSIVNIDGNLDITVNDPTLDDNGILFDLDNTATLTIGDALTPAIETCSLKVVDGQGVHVYIDRDAAITIDGNFVIDANGDGSVGIEMNESANGAAADAQFTVNGNVDIDMDGGYSMNYRLENDADLVVTGYFDIDYNNHMGATDADWNLNNFDLEHTARWDVGGDFNFALTNSADDTTDVDFYIDGDAVFHVGGNFTFIHESKCYGSFHVNSRSNGSADDGQFNIDGNFNITIPNNRGVTISTYEDGDINIGGNLLIDILDLNMNWCRLQFIAQDQSSINVTKTTDIDFDVFVWGQWDDGTWGQANYIRFDIDHDAKFETNNLIVDIDKGQEFNILLNSDENNSPHRSGSGSDAQFIVNNDFIFTSNSSVTGANGSEAGSDFDFYQHYDSDFIVRRNMIITMGNENRGDIDVFLDDDAGFLVEGNLDIDYYYNQPGNQKVMIDLDNNSTFTVGKNSDGDDEYFKLDFDEGHEFDINLANSSIMTIYGDLELVRDDDDAGSMHCDVWLSTNAQMIIHDDLIFNNIANKNYIDFEVSDDAILTVVDDIDFTACNSAEKGRIQLINNGRLNIGGNFLRDVAPNNFGELDADISSTVVNYNGSTEAQTFAIDGAETFRYDNVYFNNTSGSGVTLGGNINTTNVMDDVRTQSGLAITGGFLTTTNATKTFEVANGATWRTNTAGATGGLSTGGYQSIGATSTVDFYGADMTVPVLLANSTATQQDFGNIIVRGTGTKTLAGNESVVTLCDIQSSVLYCSTNTWNGAGDLTISGGELRLYKAAVTQPELTGTYAITAGLVNFAASGAQSVRGETYYNVQVAGDGTKTLAGNVDINGYLTIDSGDDILDAGTNRTINLAGNWTNNGTFTPQSGDVIFDGAGAQQINGTAISGFYDLTISNSGNTVTMNNDVTLSNQLDFNTSGYIDINTNDLTITGWVDGCIPNLATDRYVIVDNTGFMKITGVSNTETAIFPIGLSSSSTDFARVDIDNNDAANTSFDVNICTYVNMEGTCSGGTQITTDGVGRTWSIVSSSTDATVGLYWDTSKEVGTFDNSNCAATHHNGTKWKSLAATAASTNYSGSIYYVAGPTTSFSPFTVGDGILLPIELLAFNADWEDESKQQAIITWATASEINNDYFEIQRSTDATNWETIGEELGAGNSSSMIDYSFIDYSPENGVSYYRLKQTDFDGRYEYSETKSIAKQGAESLTSSFKIFPNPTSNLSDTKLQIDGFKSNEEIQMVIKDVYGRTIYSRDITTDDFGRTIRTIDPQNMLSSGTYFVIVTSGETIHTQKLNVQL